MRTLALVMLIGCGGDGKGDDTGESGPAATTIPTTGGGTGGGGTGGTTGTGTGSTPTVPTDDRCFTHGPGAAVWYPEAGADAASPDDTGDTGATIPTEPSFEDRTAELAAGTLDAPAIVYLESNGELLLCGGTWHATLVVDADRVQVTGSGGAADNRLELPGGARTDATFAGVWVASGDDVAIHGLTVVDATAVATPWPRDSAAVGRLELVDLAVTGTVTAYDGATLEPHAPAAGLAVLADELSVAGLAVGVEAGERGVAAELRAAITEVVSVAVTGTGAGLTVSGSDRLTAEGIAVIDAPVDLAGGTLDVRAVTLDAAEAGGTGLGISGVDVILTDLDASNVPIRLYAERSLAVTRVDLSACSAVDITSAPMGYDPGGVLTIDGLAVVDSASVEIVAESATLADITLDGLTDRGALRISGTASGVLAIDGLAMTRARAGGTTVIDGWSSVTVQDLEWAENTSLFEVDADLVLVDPWVHDNDVSDIRSGGVVSFGNLVGASGHLEWIGGVAERNAVHPVDGRVAFTETSMVVTDALFAENTGPLLGGPGNVLERTTFVDNQGDILGAVTATDCVWEDNTGDNSGAINGFATVTRCRFHRNTALDGLGGAISNGPVIATDCDFGEGPNDNSPDDVFLSCSGESFFYGDGVSFEVGC